MRTLQPTPEEKIAGLQQLVEANKQEIDTLRGRVEALEAREVQREGTEAADSQYLQAQLFGAASVVQSVEAGTEKGNSYTGELK